MQADLVVRMLQAAALGVLFILREIFGLDRFLMQLSLMWTSAMGLLIQQNPCYEQVPFKIDS